MARAGIEPATHGFSVRSADSQSQHNSQGNTQNPDHSPEQRVCQRVSGEEGLKVVSPDGDDAADDLEQADQVTMWTYDPEEGWMVLGSQAGWLTVEPRHAGRYADQMVSKGRMVVILPSNAEIPPEFVSWVADKRTPTLRLYTGADE